MSDAPHRFLLVNDIGRPSGGGELQMLAIRDATRARGHAVRPLSSDATLTLDRPLLADRACKGRTDVAQWSRGRSTSSPGGRSRPSSGRSRRTSSTYGWSCGSPRR